VTSSAQRQDGPSGPFPELEEPKRADPGLRDLSFADWRAVLLRAGKESLDDNVPMMASALAYSAFFAIPSVLLLVLGVFTLVADQATITEIVDKLTAVAPEEVAKLFGQSLERLSERPSAGILLTVVGLVLALWSLSSAMSTVITALNVAYDRDDRRGFVRKRLTALGLGIAVGAAVLLAGTLLVLGPHLQSWLGGALDARTVAAPRGRPAPGLRARPLPRAGRRPSALAARHARLDRRGRRLAPRLGRVLALHDLVRVVRQDVGDARGRHRDDDLALARRDGAPLRRRAERRDRTEPSAA
jgi:hypothetical protein